MLSPLRPTSHRQRGARPQRSIGLETEENASFSFDSDGDRIDGNLCGREHFGVFELLPRASGFVRRDRGEFRQCWPWKVRRCEWGVPAVSETAAGWKEVNERIKNGHPQGSVGTQRA